MSERSICLRYQEVHGDSLTFSCECNGADCPDDPRRAGRVDGPHLDESIEPPT